MCGNEIGDVNVIPDAGAVRRWIVGAEDPKSRSQPERGLDRDLDQVVDRPVRPSGSAPATLK
jgi:hypothetical protein